MYHKLLKWALVPLFMTDNYWLYLVRSACQGLLLLSPIVIYKYNVHNMIYAKYA